LVVIWALVILTASAFPASSTTRHVVMLFDERLEFPGLANLEAEFVRTITASSPDDIETYREPMDLSRFGSDAYRALLRDYLRAKYSNRKIDAAVAFFGPALEFLLNNGDAIFPGTPIVFCGPDRGQIGDRALPAHVSGVLLKREFAPTLELALSLHPGTKQVVVVAGTSEFDTRLLDLARQQFSDYATRLTFTYLTTLPLQKLLTELARLPPHTIVLFTTLFRDGAGEPYVTHEVVPLISTAANAPLYGFLDQYLGRGIVGGSLYSSATLGIEAAKLVLQVFDGSERSGPSFVELSGNKLMFDWRQMQRWGISERRLPPGSEVLFSDPTVWEQYRGYILAFAAAFLTQGALIFWLFYERGGRQRAVILARNTMSELAQVNRMATAGELSASIAHEIKQPIAGIVLNAQAALRFIEKPDIEEVRESLKEIVSEGFRASDIITNLRAMFKHDVQEKTPVDITKLVSSTLALLMVDLQKRGIVLQTQHDDRLPQVLGNQVQLQQVILNLVMNAVEAMSSSQTRALRIKTQLSHSNKVHVSIEDTGTGINPSDVDRLFKPMFTTKARGMGMGLSICQSIIESHEGRIWASPRENGGSIFQFELPTTANKD
jgi:signal transduction histidine kinase